MAELETLSTFYYSIYSFPTFTFKCITTKNTKQQTRNNGDEEHLCGPLYLGRVSELSLRGYNGVSSTITRCFLCLHRSFSGGWLHCCCITLRLLGSSLAVERQESSKYEKEIYNKTLFLF